MAKKQVDDKWRQILSELKSGVYRPIYLLMGAEPYFIDVISNYIEKNALPEGDKDFNQTIFYGKDAKVIDIIHEADQYPMMAERRLVMLKEAQELDKAPGQGGDREHFDDFAVYAEHLMESSILVICYKYDSIAKTKKIYKSISKLEASGQAWVMESPKIYDNQVTSWVEEFASDRKLSFAPEAVAMMAEYIGTNLANLASAMDKLKLVADSLGQKTITAEIVSKNVGVSNAYSVFELRDALLARNVSKVNRIVSAFGRNEKENPIQAIIPRLFDSYQKVFAYHYLSDKRPAVAAPALGETEWALRKIEMGASNYNARKCLQVIDLLREYDMKSKGFNYPSVSSSAMLGELVFRILN